MKSGESSLQMRLGSDPLNGADESLPWGVLPLPCLGRMVTDRLIELQRLQSSHSRRLSPALTALQERTKSGKTLQAGGSGSSQGRTS